MQLTNVQQNAAFDLARVLKRLGADVTILSWFPMDQIPADAEEVKSEEERIIEFLKGNIGRNPTIVSLDIAVLNKIALEDLPHPGIGEAEPALDH